MTYDRRTVSGTLEVEGVGLHGGQPVRVRIEPGEDGIAFRRGAVRTPARPENVTDTSRCTRLGEVSTIEHLMSAFAGLGVTDAEVEVEGDELPGLDGSARLWVEGILATGTTAFAQAQLPELFTRVFHHEGDIKVAVSKGTGHWRYEYITGDRWPGTQVAEVVHASEEYVEEVASARTFAMAEEVPKLIELGLGRGLDESSAVIVGIEGYKNEVRFANELARHKLLDLIGDLYLCGAPIAMLNVVAERSGHRTHVAAAHLLQRALHG